MRDYILFLYNIKQEKNMNEHTQRGHQDHRAKIMQFFKQASRESVREQFYKTVSRLSIVLLTKIRFLSQT